ncbi:serine/threonine protein kinase, partial [Corynebacterium striatum]
MSPTHGHSFSEDELDHLEPEALEDPATGAAVDTDAANPGTALNADNAEPATQAVPYDPFADEDEVGTSAVAFDPFADEDDESDEGADVAGTYTDPDNIAALIAELGQLRDRRKQ